MVLVGVPDERAGDPLDQHGRAVNRREVVDLDADAQGLGGGADERRRVELLPRDLLEPQAGVVQQVVEQGLGTLAQGAELRQMGPGLGREGLPGVLLDPLGQALHPAERFLEVVGGQVGEPLQRVVIRIHRKVSRPPASRNREHPSPCPRPVGL